MLCMSVCICGNKRRKLELQVLQLKPQCWKPLGHYLCTHEPGRLGYVIYTQKGVNGYVYPVAVSQKVMKNLPVSFYSRTPGFKKDVNIFVIRLSVCLGLSKNLNNERRLELQVIVLKEDVDIP